MKHGDLAVGYLEVGEDFVHESECEIGCRFRRQTWGFFWLSACSGSCRCLSRLHVVILSFRVPNNPTKFLDERPN